MKQITKLLIVATFLFGPYEAFAGNINLRKDVNSYLKMKVEESIKLLPEKYFHSVRGKIEIEDSSFLSDKYLGEDLCDLNEKVKFGTVRRNSTGADLIPSTVGHKIRISKRLIELAQSNKTIQKCSHKTFDRLLLATIIHELTHVKDNFEKISVNPDFQRIVGVKSVRSISNRPVLNQNISASPDSYEFKNLQESLAVNAEYFFLDPDFECRKPATANFLSRMLGHPLSGNCEKSNNVLIQSSYLEDNYMRTSSISPERIYQIHYLFAGKGQALMSRWGHSMFRLIVCAPHRKSVGPDCMKDVSHHLVLSYRAYMSNFDLSYVKGMLGGYPSQLFVFRFHEVQQEYTKLELRDLYSVPLKITMDQKRDFLDLTLERFWAYQGKYYFIDNNCGTETQKHLAVALDEEQSELIGSITPLKIYNDVVKKKNQLALADVEGLKREELIARGILTPSLYNELNEYYQNLVSVGIFKEKKLDTFLKKTTADQRLSLYRKFLETYKYDGSRRKLLMMKIDYLERYLFSKFSMSIPAKALQKMNESPTLKEQVLKMGESLKLLKIQPWEIIRSDYGVPLDNEFSQSYASFFQERKASLNNSIENQMKNIQKILGEKYFREELEEWENFKLIKKIIDEQFINMNGEIFFGSN